MEKVVKEMRAEEHHQHQDVINQQQEIKAERTGNELEARLKTQEFKEMLKHLK